MLREDLISQIHQKKSFLCIGLDTDYKRIPEHLLKFEDPVFEFNKQIIDATHALCVAYKPNVAFYEALGAKGWQSLEKTIGYIPDEHFVIADAKRGDIGNTSEMYAEAFFKHLDCDAITVSPYMGSDSVYSYLEYNNKWIVVLGLTSNKSSAEIQKLTLDDGQMIFQKLLKIASNWGSSQNTMFVVGATHPEEFKNVRKIIPDHFLLVPGIGAQGGNLEEVCRYGLNRDVGLLVNSSRGIIYAGNDHDFAEEAAEKAREIQQAMSKILGKF